MGEIVYFSEGKLIEQITKSAYEKACHGDWSCFEDLKLIDIPQLAYIYQSVFECLVTTLKAQKFNENQVYEWFRKNYQIILGADFEIIEKANNVHHIPDFWVRHCEEDIPVECKCEIFNKRALNQLERYMNFYKANHGIAVAQRCIVELPPNIKFVSFDIEDIYKM